MTENDDDAQARRVREIRARVEAATPGPWKTWPDGTEESVESESVGRFVCHLNSNMRQYREDSDFIANARADVPWLLARLDEVTAERNRVYAAKQNADREVYEARNQVEELTLERDALQQRVASLEGWAEAANAWAVHALGIAIDRRIPSADMIRDGQAIVEGLRAALAAAATPGDRGDGADG